MTLSVYFKKSFTGMVFITVFLVLVFSNGCSGCGEGCSKCYSISQICAGCMKGYWMYYNYCKRCPINCEECQNDRDCSTCNIGFYGTNCTQKCTLCKDGICDINGGQCINGCIDGYYEHTASAIDKTCRMCSYNCKLCKNHGNCSECDNGFYKLSRENVNGEPYTVCYPCPSFCEECDTYNNCTLCKQGTYGQLCLYNCSDSQCHRCNIVDDVEKCTECAIGYILDGTICFPELNCSQHCAIGCDENQLCVGGCKDGWSGQTCTKQCVSQCQKCQQNNNSSCTKCKKNFFGSSCNIPCNGNCSENLLDEMCSLDDGFCVNGCTGGYWGDTCNKTCNVGCNSPRCNQTNGFCATCHRKYFGDACEHQCSIYCADNDSSSHICEKSYGKCILGCENGYNGGRCEDTITTQILSATEKSDEYPSKPDCNETQFYLFGILTGVGISVVVVVAGIGLFCFVRRRQKFASKTADTRASIEEKEYENTAMGIMTLRRSADTDYYNESKGYDQTPLETSLNVYERLHDNKQDDQQQYTELGKAERK